MKFSKMHGLGNDYVYVNCFEQQVDRPAELAKIISDRHRGIGSDGLILICPSKTADVAMRIFNADGSEAEMCGNGIRCVAKYAYEHKLTKTGRGSYPSSLSIETRSGILTVGLITDDNNKVQRVRVNMGQPILTPNKIPVKLPGDKVIEQPIEVLGQRLSITCVSMGNPHAVIFCDNVAAIELVKFGTAIESHRLFPNRVNVHFAQCDKSTEFTMRTWERGSGITMACGTGACACCVAGVITDRLKRICTAHLPGGDLNLNWSEQDNCVYMTGPAIHVFDGIWPDS